MFRKGREGMAVEKREVDDYHYHYHYHLSEAWSCSVLAK